MQIGPYTLIEELACGGMAQLWLVHRVWPDGKRRSCVLKLPRLSAVTDEALLWQFVEESRLAIMLRHNNIVSVFDVGVHEGLPYLVMDYISGADLAQLVRAQARLALEWPVETAVHVVREVAQGLNHAHDFEVAGVHQQIVHRDVASKNVMIDGTGGVLLADFGVATSIRTQTSRIHVKGTLAFMAPEHYLGRATPASDVFGLGCTFWELLAGRPFRGHLTGQALIEAVVAGAVEPVGRELPAVVQRVLEGMLDPDARCRITLQEVLVALEDFPSRRRALQRMVSANFGAASRRTGLSQIHFAASKELLDTLAVVKVAGVLPDGPARTVSGQPSPPPVDFVAMPVPGTVKVDPMAAADEADDELASDSTTSIEERRVLLGTSRADSRGAAERSPADATVRISGAVVAGVSRSSLAGAREARGGTVLMPPRGVLPAVRVTVEPGAPMRGTTERAIPRHPVVVAEHGPMSSQASAGSPVESARDPGIAAVGKQRALFVGALVVLTVLLGWGSTRWLPTVWSSPVDAKDQLVASNLEAAVPGARPTDSEPAPPLVDPLPTPRLDAKRPGEPADPSELDGKGVAQDPTRAEAGVESEQVEERASDARVAPPAPKANKPKPRAPKPVPTLELTVRRGLVGFAELRIGNRKPQEVPATGSLALRVAPGTYTLRTRTEPGGAWSTIRYTFFSDMKYGGHIERSGLIIGAQRAK